MHFTAAAAAAAAADDDYGDDENGTSTLETADWSREGLAQVGEQKVCKLLGLMEAKKWISTSLQLLLLLAAIGLQHKLNGTLTSGRTGWSGRTSVREET